MKNIIYSEYYYIYVEEENKIPYTSRNTYLGIAVTSNFIVTNLKSAITQ